jgi:hypothetical protein
MGRLFRPDQPLGRAISGTEETVSGISRKQMLDYMYAYYHPKNILVSVSGSFSVSAGVDVAKAHRAKDYFLSQLSMALEDTLEHLLWVGERVMDRGELPDKKEINENIESVTV